MLQSIHHISIAVAAGKNQYTKFHVLNIKIESIAKISFPCQLLDEVADYNDKSNHQPVQNMWEPVFCGVQECGAYPGR